MKTVYIVDDSVLIRERLLELISELEETRVVGQTGDPLEAMKDIRAFRPDIVILDLQLPHRSGVTLLRDIRRAGIETHVIILTNFAFPQYRKECLEAGAEFFLSKAKDFDLLTSILEGFDPTAARDENFKANRGRPSRVKVKKPP